MYTIMKIKKDMFEYLKETRKNKDEWERHLSYFWKDANGEQYILLHGGEDGKVYMPYFGYYTADELYEYMVRQLYIKNGQRLNIVCCYGKNVKSTAKKYGKYINAVNNTNSCGRIIPAKKEDGTYELLVFSDDSIKNKVKGFFYAALNS